MFGHFHIGNRRGDDAAAKNCHSSQFLILPSFLLAPLLGPLSFSCSFSSRRSIHWSDIPLRSREERCSVGVENRARAEGAQVVLGGGRGRLFPFTDVPREGRASERAIERGSPEMGVSQPLSKVTWRRWSRTFMQYECERRRRRRHLPSLSVSRGIKESGGIDGAGGWARAGGGVKNSRRRV